MKYVLDWFFYWCSPLLESTQISFGGVQGKEISVCSITYWFISGFWSSWWLVYNWRDPIMVVQLPVSYYMTNFWKLKEFVLVWLHILNEQLSTWLIWDLNAYYFISFYYEYTWCGNNSCQFLYLVQIQKNVQESSHYQQFSNGLHMWQHLSS